MEAAEGAFGSELEDHDWEREQKLLPPSRALAAYDGDKAVGLAAAYAFDLSIPGGELPCAGVTWVGVLPTHRRRGILRDFMQRQLEDVHGWGEPLAALWASEASIYGRFGYGMAVPGIVAKSNPRRFTLKHDPPSNLRVRLIDATRRSSSSRRSTTGSARVGRGCSRAPRPGGRSCGLPTPRSGGAVRAGSSMRSPRWTGPPRATRRTGSRTSGRTASPRARCASSSSSAPRPRSSSSSGASSTRST